MAERHGNTAKQLVAPLIGTTSSRLLLPSVVTVTVFGWLLPSTGSVGPGAGARTSERRCGKSHRERPRSTQLDRASSERTVSVQRMQMMSVMEQ